MSDYPQEQVPQAPQAPQVPFINQVPAAPGYPPGYMPPQGGGYAPPPMQPGWNGQPIQQEAQTESWILEIGGAPEMHLGFLKDTFKRGSVLTLDLTNNRVIINGRVFYDTRDVDLLKSQRRKALDPNTPPKRPWIIPYTEEDHYEVKNGYAAPTTAPNVHNPRDHSMPIVQEDSTTREPIDIRHTKVAANNAASRVDHRERVAGAPMEIIRGDETVEDRIARLAGKGDPRSIQEREQLKRQPWKPEIIHDDSYGAGVSRSEISMNAGQHLISREQAAYNAENSYAHAEANARKVAADQRRGYGAPPMQQQPMPQQAMDVDPSLYDEIAPGFPDVPQAPMQQAPQGPPPAQAPSTEDARIDQLEGQVAGIAANMGDMMAMMQTLVGQQAAPTAPVAPAAVEPERTPVTDEAQVAAVAAAQPQG